MGLFGFGSNSVSSTRHSSRRKVRSKTKRRVTHRRVRKAPHRRKTHHYKSKRRIHRTKNGQPYIILASGKARFIKKSSASSSRKRRGGRY